MINKEEIINILQELKPELFSEFSVKEIGLFGSFSDNSFTDDSDIDLLVKFEKPTGWKILSLELYLEKVLGRRVDLVTEKALKEQIKTHILKQVLYI